MRRQTLGRLLPWALVAGQGWFINLLVKKYGRALMDQERLRERLARATGSGGEVIDQAGGTPSVVAARRAADLALYAEYQRRRVEVMQATPPYPAGQFAGAGVVIVAGGPRYFTNAWVCLTMLRRVLGCRLPIQVWYLGAAEMSPRMVELLQPFDVDCVDALEVRRRHPIRALGGWQCKAYAILHCPFKEVIFLDADNVPLIDPAELLISAEYQETGAIFWPDLGSLGREQPIWEICRVLYRDEPEFESGQIVIDKERSWAALHLTQHLNDQSDFYYRHIHGDKETFHMAWRMLDQPYSMPAQRPTWITGLISRGDENFADVLLQYDFAGRAIFQHRTGAKWTAWGENFRVPGFEYDALCRRALTELRQRWDGRVAIAPTAGRVTAAEAAILQSPYFLYRRVGSGQRVLALLPQGRIGDGEGPGEQAWHLEEVAGTSSLIIEGYDTVTCRLTLARDGTWKGSSLHDERLPIELIPLGEPVPGQALAATTERRVSKDAGFSADSRQRCPPHDGEGW